MMGCLTTPTANLAHEKGHVVEFARVEKGEKVLGKRTLGQGIKLKAAGETGVVSKRTEGGRGSSCRRNSLGNLPEHFVAADVLLELERAAKDIEAVANHRG